MKRSSSSRRRIEEGVKARTGRMWCQSNRGGAVQTTNKGRASSLHSVFPLTFFASDPFVPLSLCTRWGGHLFRRFCKMFSESSQDDGLYTAAAMLPKQAWGTLRKHVTKPFPQPAAPDCTVEGKRHLVFRPRSGKERKREGGMAVTSASLKSVHTLRSE